MQLEFKNMNVNVNIDCNGCECPPPYPTPTPHATIFVFMNSSVESCAQLVFNYPDIHNEISFGMQYFYCFRSFLIFLLVSILRGEFKPSQLLLR